MQYGVLCFKEGEISRVFQSFEGNYDTSFLTAKSGSKSHFFVVVLLLLLLVVLVVLTFRHSAFRFQLSD